MRNRIYVSAHDRRVAAQIKGVVDSDYAEARKAEGGRCFPYLFGMASEQVKELLDISERLMAKLDELGSDKSVAVRWADGEYDCGENVQTFNTPGEACRGLLRCWLDTLDYGRKQDVEVVQLQVAEIACQLLHDVKAWKAETIG